MFSLTIWLSFFLSHVIIAGIAISWAARSVNSSKTRFRTGIFTMLILYAINIVLISADRFLFPKQDEQTALTLLAHGLTLSIVDLFIALALFRCTFKLTFTNDFKKYDLGPNDFFLIGDDLERSFDSRMTGPVDPSKLIGVADFRFLPITRIAFLR